MTHADAADDPVLDSLSGADAVPTLAALDQALARASCPGTAASEGLQARGGAVRPPDPAARNARMGVGRLRGSDDDGPVEIIDGEDGAIIGAAELRRSFGRTRRRPRRGGSLYRKARGTGLTMLTGPVAAMVYGVDAARYLSERLAARGGAVEEERFRRPDSMPRDDLSVADVVEKLQTFPMKERGHSASRSFFASFGHEGIGMMTGQHHVLAAVPHLYPRHFHPVLLEGADGERIAGLQAMHHTRGPAIVIAHGLLNTKHFDYVRTLATKAFFEWGFHVVTLDLRGWGQTAWTSDAPSGGGWAEGHDIAEIARGLKQDPLITSVGVVGFSLGGCSALNAARAASQDEHPVLDGGVLAISAPTDLREAIEHISTRPPLRDPFLPIYYVFNRSLQRALRSHGLGSRFASWKHVTEEFAAPWYGVSTEEFLSRASAVTWANDVRVPTLELHAEDDFVVPVHHAQALNRAAADNPNLQVWTVPRGNHCAFSTVDRQWYYSVVRRWFEYWAVEGD